ncbi:MAG: hypothetical protein AB7T63_07435 [Planctomycetota bacterium]
MKDLPPSPTGTSRNSIKHAFSVAPVDGAISYALEIVVWESSSADYLGQGDSWVATDSSMLDELDPQLVYFPSSGYQDSQIDERLPGYQSVVGLATVTVTLAP